jgi:hypothetical protein
LIEKIELLENKILLKEESKRIHNYIIENMSLETVKRNFESILNSNE